MSAIGSLHRGWAGNLKQLLNSAKRNVLISSPFITHEGALFVHEHLPSKVRNAGNCRVITNSLAEQHRAGSDRSSSAKIFGRSRGGFDRVAPAEAARQSVHCRCNIRHRDFGKSDKRRPYAKL